MGLFEHISAAFSSGPWMWMILIAQVVSVGVILERVIHLFVLRAPKQKKLIKSFEEDIKSGRFKKALKERSISKDINPIYKVIRVGSQTAIDGGGKEELQTKIDEILLDENEKLERRTSYLSMLGNVGTLLGLLGTIVGLIQAFSAIGSEDAAQKAKMLTAGISMAMNTTAYGLIMAIPAIVMYTILQNRAQALSEDLNQASLRVYNWLTYSFDNISSVSDKK